MSFCCSQFLSSHLYFAVFPSLLSSCQLNISFTLKASLMKEALFSLSCWRLLKWNSCRKFCFIDQNRKHNGKKVQSRYTSDWITVFLLETQSSQLENDLVLLLDCWSAVEMYTAHINMEVLSLHWRQIKQEQVIKQGDLLNMMKQEHLRKKAWFSLQLR